MSTTEAGPELLDVNASDRLVAYLRETWARRSYIWYVSVNELRSRQVTNVLGNLWHLLNPALTIGVYYLIFGLLLKVDRGVENFILFLSVGLFIFQYTQRATTAGAAVIVTNSGLVKAIKFPRALLPVTSTVTETLSAMPTVFVVVAVAVLTGEPISPRWVLLIPVMAVQFVFNMGAAMFAARLTTHFRDTLQILPFVFRLLLYASGVIFSVSAYLDDGSPARWLFVLNPAFCYVETARWTIMGGSLAHDVVVSGVLWAVAMLVVGFVWFRAGEGLYARD